jgi:hypothetical protein
MKERHARFVAFRMPFEEVLHPVVFWEIEDDGRYKPLADLRVLQRPEFRAVLWDQWSLYLAGLAESDGEGLMEARKHEGGKWGGQYLGSRHLLQHRGKGEGQAGAPGRHWRGALGDQDRRQRVLLSGAGGEDGEGGGGAAGETPHGPGSGAQRRRLGGRDGGRLAAAGGQVAAGDPDPLRMRLEDLRYPVFMPSEDIRKAIDQGRQPSLSRYLKAAAYIRWGERQGYSTRPTCASRTGWWDLGKGQVPDCL